MKACECVFYMDCRIQQAIVRKLKLDAKAYVGCVADKIQCNDLQDDMENRCPLFRSTGRVYEEHKAMSNV